MIWNAIKEFVLYAIANKFPGEVFVIFVGKITNKLTQFPEMPSNVNKIRMMIMEMNTRFETDKMPIL